MMAGNRTRALVVGAGKIGTAIATLLASAPDYDVTVLDRTGQALRRAESLGYARCGAILPMPPSLAGWPPATTWCSAPPLSS
jgi:2-polyprenyl-6-methoxyphenol hydroxylase-like FAD-dependent oxidoreductase